MKHKCLQGMNELIAPLYWLFKKDTDHHAQKYAEADAFWCFMELISEWHCLWFVAGGKAGRHQ